MLIKKENNDTKKHLEHQTDKIANLEKEIRKKLIIIFKVKESDN